MAPGLLLRFWLVKLPLAAVSVAGFTVAKTVVHTAGRFPLDWGSDGRIVREIVGDQSGKVKGIRPTCKNLGVDLERKASITYSSRTVADERGLHGLGHVDSGYDPVVGDRPELEVGAIQIEVDCRSRSKGETKTDIVGANKGLNQRGQ
ncbi:hypothetical protein QYF36_022316 [Acer negundo]|nr:hypothetical protein QYF36_022316 [Acer negundo]